MTIEEYSNRMGYEQICGIEEYEEANSVYMAAGNMDKDEFCEEWRKRGNSSLIRILATQVSNGKENLAHANKMMRDTAYQILREADEIRESGLEDNADVIDLIAATLIGRKDRVKWKLNKGYCLGIDDRDYILNNLD